MKRKEFLKKGLVAGVASTTLLTSCNIKSESSPNPNINAPNIITNKKYQWKMVTTWPPNFPVVGTGCKALTEWIYKMSAGRIEIKVFGGGELVPPLQVFEAVSSGAVEMGHGASYYWAGINPAFPFFTAVPFGMNAQQMNAWMDFGGGQQLWEELYANYNILPFAAGNTGVQMGGWFNKKIDTIDDWKGLKMRMPGLGARVIEKFGATSVLSPGSELYTNLERGVIDATEWIGPYHDYNMGFHKIAKYYYYPGWHETGPVLECIVNKRDYEALPEDLREIIKTACFRSNQMMLSEFDAKNFEYLQKIKSESDVEILKYPPAVMQQMKSASTEIYEQMAEENEWVRRVWDSFRTFKQNISQWSAMTEKVFYEDVN